MHTTTCNFDLHLKGLIITPNIMHTVYNLRHTVAIITITVGFSFQDV